MKKPKVTSTKKEQDKFEKLTQMLRSQPELADKLAEALEHDRYFITITAQFKLRPDDAHDLHHFYCRHRFDTNDVLPSMQHIENDFKAKEMPNAEIKGDGWH